MQNVKTILPLNRVGVWILLSQLKRRGGKLRILQFGIGRRLREFPVDSSGN